MRGAGGTAARIAASVVLACLSILRASVSFARSTPPEYMIKAAYLYHFAMFVDWPCARASASTDLRKDSSSAPAAQCSSALPEARMAVAGGMGDLIRCSGRARHAESLTSIRAAHWRRLAATCSASPARKFGGAASCVR